jgi:peptidyl-dipeptidase Dcp
MASNVGNVYKLFDELIDAYKPTAIKEQEAVKKLAKEEEGDDFEIKPWDGAFYSHKLKLRDYDIDPEMLRPYLEVSNVIKGVFGLATKLYGITFKENKDIPVYHKDVKAFEVYDNDGSYLALLYVDFYPRKGKQDGAWMTEYQGQHIEKDGTNVRPHVSLVLNLSKPTEDKPALLRLGEVETFLHEFGHALHGMFANTRFESLSGTNVWWDFVEMPSQFMENYAVEKEFLHTFAFHYKTGEPMPDDLIDKVVKSRTFNAATACLRQVSFGLLDMAYYTLEKPFTENIIEFEKEAWKKAIIGKQLPDTCMTTQFSHIMAGGYAAGYYSYKWAEVLEADAFSVFKHNGIFDRKTAQSFRDNILSRGGTEHPMTLYKRFRGQEPAIDALLERDGVKKKA